MKKVNRWTHVALKDWRKTWNYKALRLVEWGIFGTRRWTRGPSCNCKSQPQEPVRTWWTTSLSALVRNVPVVPLNCQQNNSDHRPSVFFPKKIKIVSDVWRASSLAEICNLIYIISASPPIVFLICWFPVMFNTWKFLEGQSEWIQFVEII